MAAQPSSASSSSNNNYFNSFSVAAIFDLLKIFLASPQRPQKLRLFPHFFLLPSAPL
jgi:hypothetical protein